MKVCPRCNVEHKKNGTFCSRSCANSRSWSDEDKKKKSEAAKTFLKDNVHPLKGKPGWKHSDEMKEIKRKKSLEMWDKKGRRTAQDLIIKNRMGVSKYRATKMNLTPKNANLNLIKEIYKNCPDGYEVDHMIALAEGGLHHENNLQYLPAMENRRKNKTQNYDKNLVISWQDVIIS